MTKGSQEIINAMCTLVGGAIGDLDRKLNILFVCLCDYYRDCINNLMVHTEFSSRNLFNFKSVECRLITSRVRDID